MIFSILKKTYFGMGEFLLLHVMYGKKEQLVETWQLFKIFILLSLFRYYEICFRS